ncbi:MAG: hypothetical protein CTY12_08085 [Methylotenera sp.]|nr:MAG: hypothetical protein CTY12_08085 [Methylotenera sp.]
MELNSEEVRQDHFQLIEIRKVKGDFGSIDDYLAFRDDLVGKSIHPWLNQACQRNSDHESIPEGIWALTASRPHESEVNSIVLAFAELDFEETAETRLPFEGVNSFDEWVSQFNPKTMDDWLMVPKLFLIHLRTGRNLPALTTTPDPWIDAMLCESRGMLMWSYQFIEMIRMIANVGITEATKIHSKYVMMPLKHREMIEKIYYEPTNQTLMQIFRERTVGMQHLGSPDYFLADWLLRHYSPATQIYTTGSDKITNDKKAFDDNEAELSSQSFVDIKALLPNVASVIDQSYNDDNPHKITGIASGFTDLDSITGGFQHGDLIIVAGRPSMGNTLFALNIVEYVALENKLPVAIFSMDTSSNQLAISITALVGRLDKHRMLAGDINEDGWERLLFALGTLNEAPIYINDEAGLNSNEICERSLKLKKQCGELGLIVVDCLQLISGLQGETQTVAAAESLRSLKLLAKQLHCPIIILSNLNRNLERRSDKRPILTDLQTSNYADVVLFTYRDEVYTPDSADKGTAEVIIAKHRNGRVGRVCLNFNDQYGLFENYIIK